MIKAKSDHPTRGPLFIFGLSAGNVQRLTAGQPIRIVLDEMGVHGEVFIMYGETEQSIIAELRKSGLELPPSSEWKPTQEHPA